MPRCLLNIVLGLELISNTMDSNRSVLLLIRKVVGSDVGLEVNSLWLFDENSGILHQRRTRSPTSTFLPICDSNRVTVRRYIPTAFK